jgi:hypothetical protein
MKLIDQYRREGEPPIYTFVFDQTSETGDTDSGSAVVNVMVLAATHPTGGRRRSAFPTASLTPTVVRTSSVASWVRFLAIQSRRGSGCHLALLQVRQYSGQLIIVAGAFSPTSGA